MTHVLITICCKEKDESPGLLPAIQRYQSEWIGWVYRKSLRQDVPMLILSGKFGLISPTQPIPWYDHALQMEEVPGLVPKLVEKPRKLEVTKVSFYARPREMPGWAPYHAALEQACREAGVELRLKNGPYKLCEYIINLLKRKPNSLN